LTRVCGSLSRFGVARLRPHAGSGGGCVFGSGRASRGTRGCFRTRRRMSGLQQKHRREHDQGRDRKDSDQNHRACALSGAAPGFIWLCVQIKFLVVPVPGKPVSLPAGEIQGTTGRRLRASVFALRQRFRSSALQQDRRSPGGGIRVILLEIAHECLAEGEDGYQGMMVVGSLAVLLALLTSPPPETDAVLVTLAGALVATLTVRVMGG
jgi:hypothetical protein